VVRLLLGAGADTAARNGHRITPLHAAVREGGEATIQILLGAGADMAARDWFGRTPRTIAEEDDALHEVAAILLAAERERSVAFAMGHQERLGAASLVRGLEPEVVRMVLDLV